MSRQGRDTTRNENRPDQRAVSEPIFVLKELVAMKKKFEKEISKLCQRFGTIAVKKGLVSADQIKEAFMEQLDDDLNGREHRLIGTILFEKDLMTWDQVDGVLKELIKVK
jgi:hypothetical protein